MLANKKNSSQTPAPPKGTSQLQRVQQVFFMLRLSPSPRELAGSFLQRGLLLVSSAARVAFQSRKTRHPGFLGFSRVETRRTKETSRNLVISLSKRRMLKTESCALSLTTRLEDKPGTGYVSAWQLALHTHRLCGFLLRCCTLVAVAREGLERGLGIGTTPKVEHWGGGRYSEPLKWRWSRICLFLI